jgi:hypothetical protein
MTSQEKKVIGFLLALCLLGLLKMALSDRPARAGGPAPLATPTTGFK